MATATPCHRPRPFSSSSAASSLQSSSIFPLHYTKRFLLIPSSPNFYSSSCCCSLNDNDNGRKRLSRKSVQLIIDDVDAHLGNGKPFASPLTFQSLFGKRAYWRRIFFVSKKVRGIILLNLITIIYGKLLTFDFYFLILLAFVFLA